MIVRLKKVSYKSSKNPEKVYNRYDVSIPLDIARDFPVGTEFLDIEIKALNRNREMI